MQVVTAVPSQGGCFQWVVPLIVILRRRNSVFPQLYWKLLKPYVFSNNTGVKSWDWMRTKNICVNTNEERTKDFWCRKILGGHVKRLKPANETKKVIPQEWGGKQRELPLLDSGKSVQLCRAGDNGVKCCWWNLVPRWNLVTECRIYHWPSPQQRNRPWTLGKMVPIIQKHSVRVLL